MPPVELLYQLITPAEAVADNVVEPGPQMVESLTVVMAGILLTVATTGVLTPVEHPLTDA